MFCESSISNFPKCSETSNILQATTKRSASSLGSYSCSGSMSAPQVCERANLGAYLDLLTSRC